MKNRLLIMLCFCMVLYLTGCGRPQPEQQGMDADTLLRTTIQGGEKDTAVSKAVIATELFGKDFHDQFNLTTLRRVGWIDSVVIGNTLYRLMRNGDIYQYNVISGEYSLYCTVPTPPEGVGAETTYSSLSKKLKAALEKSVYRMFVREGELYGYSSVSGAIGKIDEKGISWLDVRLDNAIQREQDSAWPNPLQYLYAEGNILYAYYDRALNEYGEQPCNGVMLAFNLDTGKCITTDLPDTYMMCPYQTGYALLLRGNSKKGAYLSSLELSTGTIVNLDTSVPFLLDAEAFENSWMFSEQVGGLAYDISNKRIYLAVPNALYTANDGQELTPCEIQGDIWDSLSGRSGFILENGAYFLNSILVHES